MTRSFPKKLLALAGALASTAIQAQVFQGTVNDQTGVTGQATFKLKDAEQAANQLTNENLQNLLPSYVNTDAVTSTLDYRGVGILASYALSSPTLNVVIPELGFSSNFSGQTRTESALLFVDFLKKNSDFKRRLGKLLIARSPADPLAGNPNSLQSVMIMSDFSAALAAMNPDIAQDEERRAGFSPVKLAQAGGAQPVLRSATAVGNMAGAGLFGSSLSYQSIAANALTVPLQYNARSDLDPRRGLSFRAPITYAAYEGSTAGHASLAAAYRIPINRQWVVTPAVGYGIAASKDLGAAGHLVSASVTSAYGFKFPAFDMVLANMVGYYKSLNLSGGDFGYDPQLSSVAFRNGLVFSRPFNLAGAQRSGQFYVIDTRTAGSELFVDNWQEIGVTVGSRARINSARDYGSISLGYLRSASYKGFTLQANYLF
jgi:hypothetical protein